MKVIGNTDSDGKLVGISSGAISSGAPVVINSQNPSASIYGKIQAVSATGVATSLESASTYESGAANLVSSAYDEESGKTIVFYTDDGNSGYPTVVIITPKYNGVVVSTPQVITSAANQFDLKVLVVLDSDGVSRRIFLGYRNSTSGIYCHVGLIQEATDPANATLLTGIQHTIYAANVTYVSFAFDSYTHKIGCFYRHGTTNPQGQGYFNLLAVCGLGCESVASGAASPSGETISWCQIVYDESAKMFLLAFNNADASKSQMSVIKVSGNDYDAFTLYLATSAFSEAGSFNIQMKYIPKWRRTLITYKTDDVAPNNYDFCSRLVGIQDSVGTPGSYAGVLSAELVINANNTPTQAWSNSIDYNPYEDKVIVAYKDGADSNYGKYAIGTITNGDTMTWATSVSYFSGTVAEKSVAVTYVGNVRTDINQTVGTDRGGQNLYLLFYTNSSVGYVKRLYLQGTNLLPSNGFVGLAQAGSIDGQKVVINSAGSIARNLTGLIAGKKYFIHMDGTLNVSPDNSNIVAGTAISSSELIVKG